VYNFYLSVRCFAPLCRTNYWRGLQTERLEWGIWPRCVCFFFSIPSGK